MTIGEKVAYLKGLFEGMEIGTETKEGKLFNGILDILSDIAEELDDVNENMLDLGDEIDELSDDLAEVEDIVYDEDEDDEDYEDYEDDEYDDDDDDYEMDDDPVFYSVTCPSCENEITIDEDVLALGEIECPNCGQKMIFDVKCPGCEGGCGKDDEEE